MNNYLSQVIISVGHETHPANGLIINDFKNISYQRSSDEQTTLWVIYNKVYPIIIKYIRNRINNMSFKSNLDLCHGKVY